MPNLVAYNSGTTISNALQFGTIVMDVNNTVNQGSLLWCPDFGICNQYIIVTDSYTNGKTNQLNSRAMGFQTSGLTDSDLINGINRLASSKFEGPFGTLQDAITWAISEGYFITNQEYPSIVTSGSVLNLDSNFTASYPLVFNSWYDLTGNGNTGLLNNGITYDSSLRGSLIFNGTNQFVSVTPTFNIPEGNSNYTINTWFNPSSLGDGGLVGWGNYNTSNEVNALRLSSSGIVNYWWDNDLSVSYSFTLGDWYNAVATFDGTTRSIWVNGTLIGSDTPSGHNVPYSNNMTVGVTNSTEFFSGNMGVVQIFDRALSSTEIIQNYNALLPRYNGTYTDPCDIAPQCAPSNYYYSTSDSEVCNGGGFGIYYPTLIDCSTATLTNETGVLTSLPPTIWLGPIEGTNIVRFIRIEGSTLEYHRNTNCVSCIIPTPTPTPTSALVCTSSEYQISNSGNFYWTDCNGIERYNYFTTGEIICICQQVNPTSPDGGTGFLTGGGCECPIEPTPTPTPTPTLTPTSAYFGFERTLVTYLNNTVACDASDPYGAFIYLSNDSTPNVGDIFYTESSCAPGTEFDGGNLIYKVTVAGSGIINWSIRIDDGGYINTVYSCNSSTPTPTPTVTPSPTDICPAPRAYTISNSGNFYWIDCHGTVRYDYFTTGTEICICNNVDLPTSSDGGTGFLTGGGCSCI